MFGSSSRLFILFNGPLSLLHHRPSTLLRLTRRRSLTCALRPISGVPDHLLPVSRANSTVRIKSSQHFHSKTASNALQENNSIPADAYLIPPSHPWPEWSKLLESISNAGYFDGNSNIKDEFVPNESLSMEFVDAASSCLGFARNRPDILGWLPKKDIQVLIDDGAPFLFKSAIEAERRMRSFLQEGESNEATTVDLMKYILSYASNPIIYPERIIRETTESSARNLLREMANFSCQGQATYTSDTEKFHGAGRDEQTPRNLGPNITMKRGDWICPKCNFMNFAKNANCLECEESRPQRQLTGGEWDCPQCNFFNYGRNVVCLKCECKRPGESPLPKTPSERQIINSQYENNFGNNHTPNGDDFWKPNRNLDQFHSNPSTDSRTHNSKNTYESQNAIKGGRSSGYAPFVPLPADMFAKKPEKTTIDNSEEASISRIKHTSKEEKSKKWFKKVSELHDSTNLTSAISDEDFPQIMPMRKGENRFVVSKKKDRSLTSPKYKQQQAMDQGTNSKFVPFVPFPPDYFAKKDVKQQSSENSSKATQDMNLVKETQNQEMSSKDNLNSRSSGASTHETSMILVQETQNQETCSTNNLNSKILDPEKPENNNLRSGWEGKSLEGSAVKETDPLDMSEEAKAERWFRRVAQIKDISELSQIPDEDFPSIMPMRKGVNRFVVSKRKTPLERRLTSPQYRKNLRVVSSDMTKKEEDGN